MGLFIVGKAKPDPLSPHQSDFGKETNKKNELPNLPLFLFETHAHNRAWLRKHWASQILAPNLPPPNSISAMQSHHTHQVLLRTSRDPKAAWQQMMHLWCHQRLWQYCHHRAEGWLLVILTFKRQLNENQAVKPSPNVSPLPKRQRLKLFSVTLHT